ncbi:MAG: hypothetical protein KatS3mg110_1663 [Pirellulaceae bacterium]|nr:MAG: hypothetical protein KatS3mg110_1663 [Pirellulaceae bacterium]
MMSYRWVGCGWCVCWILLGAAPLFGQLPAARLSGLYPPGGQAGQTVEVTISGADLDEATKLWFSHPGLRAEPKMAEPGPFDSGPQPVPNVFLVQIAPDVPPGFYDVRVEGLYGLSNPRTFVVGSLPEVRESEPNQEAEQMALLSLPVVVNGQSNSNGDVDGYRVALEVGQRVVFSLAAGQIDSLMDPVLRIERPDGVVVGEWDNVQGSDVVALVTASVAGEYRVLVYDALYRGGAEYVYRLTVGPFPVVDFVFPPAIEPGKTARLALWGRNLPGGAAQDVRWQGDRLERLELDLSMPADVMGKLPLELNHGAESVTLDGIRLPWQQPVVVGKQLIYAATAPVVLEQEPNPSAGKAQPLTLPCEVAGQFFPRRDEDWFQFEAKQGERWAVELFYNRLGAQGTPQLFLHRVVKNQDGTEQMTLVAEASDMAPRDLGHEFDPQSGDPYYLFTVPADGLYRILLRDGYAALRDDPRLVYRLAIRRPKPDFRLVAVPWESEHAVFLRKGGRALVRVLVLRQDGFDGPVKLVASGLPPGVTASEAIVGPESSSGMIVLTCAEDAPASISSLEIRGTAEIDGKAVERVARGGAALETRGLLQPGQQSPAVPARLIRGLLLSISSQESLPVLIDLAKDPLETSRGGILKIPYSVTRRNNYNGNINGVVYGTPANVNAPQVGIGGGATQGEFELRIPGNAPVGTYTLVLNGFVQGYQYSRNPEAAKRAAERKAELEKIVAQTAEDVKRLTDSRNAAQKALDQAKAQLQQATAARDQAAKAAAEAQANFEKAKQAAEQAAQKARQTPDDPQVAKAAQDAAAARDEAEKRAKEAATTLTDAEKALADAQEKLKKAEADRAKAEEELQAAMQRATMAQQVKQQADRLAQQLQQNSQPKNINFWTPSTPVVIRIVESPVQLEGLPEKISVKQGEKVEIPAKVTRSYGFQGPVNLNWQTSGNINGVQLSNVQIPNNQNEGKLVVNAAQNASPGQYSVRVQVQVNFNGQNVVTEKVIELSIESQAQ